MKVNQWTLGLAAVGLVSLPGVMQAEEASQHILTSLSSTTISGFVDTSAQWNLGTGNANNPAIPFNGAGKADGFNLNYVQLTIQKPLDAQDNWAAGYRVDLGFGDDLAGFGSAFSNGTSWDPTANGGAGGNVASQSSGTVGIKQAYVSLRAPVGNGIDFKMGAFDTIIGYETFERVNNPHYTHSYGYGVEPTSHTGLLASYQVSELIGVSAGVANTRSPGINSRTNPNRAESYKTYMGSLSIKAPDSFGFLAGSMLYAGVINGADNSASTAGQPAIQNYYVGATINTPWTGVKFGVAYDYVGTENGSGTATTSAHADAVSLYASIKATEKLTFLVRGEHFEQSAGVFSANSSRVLALTGTVQYDLWANVISRLEVRWDHDADGGALAFGEDAAGNADRRNALMVAANVIYKF